MNISKVQNVVLISCAGIALSLSAQADFTLYPNQYSVANNCPNKLFVGELIDNNSAFFTTRLTFDVNKFTMPNTASYNFFDFDMKYDGNEYASHVEFTAQLQPQYQQCEAQIFLGNDSYIRNITFRYGYISVSYVANDSSVGFNIDSLSTFRGQFILKESIFFN
jgi:hypothetical protein